MPACGGGLPKTGGLSSGQSATRSERAQSVLELRPDYPLQVLLTASGLSWSTFYYQAKVYAACAATVSELHLPSTPPC